MYVLAPCRGIAWYSAAEGVFDKCDKEQEFKVAEHAWPGQKSCAIVEVISIVRKEIGRRRRRLALLKEVWTRSLQQKNKFTGWVASMTKPRQLGVLVEFLMFIGKIKLKVSRQRESTLAWDLVLVKIKFAGIKAENEYIRWLHVKCVKMTDEKRKYLGEQFQTVKNWAHHRMAQVSGLVESTFFEHRE